jgi:O-methyltransferase involved in polyketide biosynthesis
VVIGLQQTKIKVDLSGVPQTSLPILYGRSKISIENALLFNDPKAVELVELMDYDFSILFDGTADYIVFATIARAMQFDNKIKTYIKEHPHASVVNLGAGFDTGFYRVDNGTIHWYDLDLPEVINVRKQLLPETDRTTCIAKSFLDPSWCQEIDTENGVFILAGGLFRYFDEARVSKFFASLADHLPGSEIVFGVESKSSSGGSYGAGWSDSEPVKRDAIQAEYMRTFKNAWNMFYPKSLKEKMLEVLTTPTKPNSSQWDDLEAWWNQLNAQEKIQTIHDFSVSLGIACRWAMEDLNEMTTWDARIIIVDQFPLFKDIPRDPSLSLSIRQFMDYNDEKGIIKISHVRV